MDNIDQSKNQSFVVIREAAYRTKQKWRLKMEDRWLSVDEIAEHLGIKRDTVYRWVNDRQMPGHKIGRLWKFNKKDVDAWVKSGGAGEAGDSSATETKTDD